jgi:predicted adenylyl cyclase CyaB
MNNIEIKFAVNSLNDIEQFLSKENDCHFSKTIHQADIYFHSKRGRLKLRIPSAGKAELISYERENLNRPRQSDYHIYSVENPDLLRTVLEETLGVKTIVIKERNIWMFRNVRIHLDQVADLGEFIEFEAVINRENNHEQSAQNLDEILNRFSIFSMELVPESYSDLLIRKEA